jgi:flavin reductase (DIM6/NTAB) family NADH-FMN oxidoreductase RutF
MSDDWRQPDEFETIASANKPFSLRVPALVVTRGKSGRINLMLSTWFTPMGLSPSSFLITIERKTKTGEFIEETGEFVIAAPEEKMFETVLYAGSASGHDEDKWAASGLTPLRAKHIAVPLIAEAMANVEFRVARTMPFDAEHTLYVGEVQACHVKKGCFDDGIYLPGSTPLLWLGKGSSAFGKKAARFAAGLGRIWEADETAPILNRSKEKRPAE